MICAMIVEPRNVPAKVKIATITIASPCSLKVSISLPMEIPAYARIGVHNGRSPIFPTCSIAYSAIGLIPGIVMKIAINEMYAIAGRFFEETFPTSS